MRRFPTPWLHTLLVLSAVLDPLSAIGTLTGSLHCDASMISEASQPHLRRARTSSGRPAAPTSQIPSTSAASHQRINTALTSRITHQPRPTRIRSLTLALEEHWELRPPPFIGPRPLSSTIALPPGTAFISTPLSTSLFPLSGHRTVNRTSARPYQGDEYERMNDASHVILHGGN